MTQFGEQFQHRIAWLLDPAGAGLNSKGKPFIVSRTYHSTLGKNATLAKHLASWFGKSELSPEMKKGFGEPGGPDKLIGLMCRLLVVHKDTEGGTYANVEKVMQKDPNAAKLMPPADFVRWADRPENKDKQPSAASAAPERVIDANADLADDCPF
jgi:hypothetical protein